jgi:ribosome-associated protein
MKKRSKTKPSIEGEAFAKAVARIAHDNRCEEVTILDLRGLSSIADFFVIATGTSDRQMQATADEIEAYSKQVGQHCYGLDGYDSASWVLADYVDVVVHIFDQQRRRYYDLELLWGDAPRLDWQSDGQ